jgi:hypothetical protein
MTQTCAPVALQGKVRDGSAIHPITGMLWIGWHVGCVPNPGMPDLHRHGSMRQFFVVAKSNSIVAALL